MERGSAPQKRGPTPWASRRQGRGVALADLLQELIQASPDFEGAVLVSGEGLVMAAAWSAAPHRGLRSGYEDRTEGPYRRNDAANADLSRPLRGAMEHWADIGAIATRAFVQSDRTTVALGRDRLEKLILLGSNGNTIITPAGPDALCVVLLRPEAKIGIASFEATRISRRIAQVLG